MPVTADDLLDEILRPADSAGASLAWKVVLINCDCHSFDEVERQLLKAVRCTLSAARAFAWEVHSRGAAVIYSGPRERCEAVASVLEDIRLAVQVTR
jgi:ATP-dependent Clp protease adapter protein ClpS